MNMRAGAAAVLAMLAVSATHAAAIPLPLDAFSPAAADALATKALGPLSVDPAIQEAGLKISAYGDRPDGLALRFNVVDLARPVVLALPNGSLYLSRGALEAVKAHPDRLNFLLASTAALAMDGKTRDADEVCELISDTSPKVLPDALIAAVERTLTPERVTAADKLAMLYLVRAGVPPMEGVRALDDLARAGAKTLCVTADLAGTPTVLDRKMVATQGAADLIKAATEFDFGVMDLAERRFKDAIPRFLTFLELLPENYAGWNNLGLCYYHLAAQPLGPGTWLLADAVAEFDTSYVTRSTRGPNLQYWQKALDAYTKAANIDPIRVEALNNLGTLYQIRREYDKARHYYDLALAQKPKFAPTLNNYGVVLAGEQKETLVPEALAKFTAAVDADPTLPEAQYNLGLALDTVKQSGSKQSYERYLALAPNGPKATDALRRLGKEPAAAGTDPAGALPAAGGVEKEIELWNRVRLALSSQRRELLAMVTGTPDQNRQLQSTEVSVLGWQRQGLVVELVSNKVNRVVAGRPPGAEAKTVKGAKVGFDVAQVKTLYGAPPAVSKQSPYDIWLYPKSGVGFFVLGDEVSKIFLFQVAD